MVRGNYLLAAAMIAAAGCAPSTQDLGFGDPSGGPATIEVQNDYWGDMVIYLADRGTRMRLGSVSAMSMATFAVPEALLMASDMRIEADPIGPDAGFRSQRISIPPGATVQLRLDSNLAMSHFTLR